MCTFLHNALLLALIIKLLVFRNVFLLKTHTHIFTVLCHFLSPAPRVPFTRAFLAKKSLRCSAPRANEPRPCASHCTSSQPMKVLHSPWLGGFWKEACCSVVSLSASVLFLAGGSDPQWPASEVMGLDPWRYNKGEVSCWIATETEGALKVAVW